MKIITIIKVLLCTVIVIFPVVGEEESILTRFEKAQYYEETEGDIEKVITTVRLCEMGRMLLQHRHRRNIALGFAI